MTAEDLVAARIAAFWLPAGQLTGIPSQDAARAMAQRYRKADGASLTQFNTGAIVIRADRVLAMTECRPARTDPAIVLGPTSKARTAVIDDIRANGPPLLAVLFRKGATDVRAWVCSTPDEVVLNGPAGPDEGALMEDVAFLRQLPGTLPVWRKAANIYSAAMADPSQAERLFAEADRIAAAVALPAETILEILHRLHTVAALAYALAEPEKAAP